MSIFGSKYSSFGNKSSSFGSAADSFGAESSGGVVAAGSGGTYNLSYKDGEAFFYDDSGDFSDYFRGNKGKKYELTVTDEASQTAIGYIGDTPPSSESLGSAENTDEDFDDPGEWACSGGWEVGSGTGLVSVTDPADNAFINQNCTGIVDGRLYKFTHQVTVNTLNTTFGNSSQSAFQGAGGGYAAMNNGVGTHNTYLTANNASTTTDFRLYCAAGSGTMTLTHAVIKQCISLTGSAKQCLLYDSLVGDTQNTVSTHASFRPNVIASWNIKRVYDFS